jgi:YHS domain-containing protein
MKKIFLVFAVLLSITSVLFAQSEDVRKKNFNIKKNIVLEGYDPVSYFDHQPQEGKADIYTMYKGITYRFATPANLNKFKTNPEKYEPAYGGWCAYAMGASGEKVRIDPETYKILDGKLYVFYNFWGNNTLTDWNKNEKQLMMKGDRNWKALVLSP